MRTPSSLARRGGHRGFGLFAVVDVVDVMNHRARSAGGEYTDDDGDGSLWMGKGRSERNGVEAMA